MNCSVEDMARASKQLKSATDTLCASYQCDWNDEVHDSYRSYVSICKETATAVTEVISKCNSICNNLNSLKIDEGISQAESIVAEEAGISV